MTIRKKPTIKESTTRLPDVVPEQKYKELELTNVEERCKVIRATTKLTADIKVTGDYREFHQELSRYSKAGADEIEALAVDA